MVRHVSTRSPAALLAVLVAALGVVLAPAAARADTASFRDARGDTRNPADVVRVTVVHSERVVVRVHHRDLTFRTGLAPESIRVVYAVPGHSPGPDFVLKVAYQADGGWQLRTAGDWGAPAGPAVPGCTGERAGVSAARDLTWVSIPRSCLGDPGQVRVQVRITVRPEDVGRADAAPGTHRLGPWVGWSAA